jgi:hypothetical protein
MNEPQETKDQVALPEQGGCQKALRKAADHLSCAVGGNGVGVQSYTRGQESIFLHSADQMAL